MRDVTSAHQSPWKSFFGPRLALGVLALVLGVGEFRFITPLYEFYRDHGLGWLFRYDEAPPSSWPLEGIIISCLATSGLFAAGFLSLAFLGGSCLFVLLVQKHRWMEGLLLETPAPDPSLAGSVRS